jgi:hypothetical protein
LARVEDAPKEITHFSLLCWLNKSPTFDIVLIVDSAEKTRIQFPPSAL